MAERFGYSTDTVASMARDLRGGHCDYFVEPKPGPKTAPAKDAARPMIIELRKAGHSIDEIASALIEAGTPLNRTGISEICTEEGFDRLWRRPETRRGGPRRETLPRAAVIDFDDWPTRCDSKVAGLLLTLPDLVALDLPAMVAAAGYPGTRVIPALSSILSLLALKLAGKRRVSHVDDLAADRGAALFAGLVALPKTTALTTYSYRLEHHRQARFLTALNQAMARTGLTTGADFDLDFHAIMHWGEDAALEKHYVPRRSQRTRSVLTFFAQDGTTQNLVYANADLSKADQANETLVFCDHWKAATGADPTRLVLDQRVTTQAVLTKLNERGVTFITLRMRSPSLIKHINGIDPKEFNTVTLDRTGNYRKPRVYEETVTLTDYREPLRQLIITGLGRDAATVLITNDTTTTARHLIGRYARRMNIEQRLAESIRSFHLDSLSSAVPLNVDHDVALTVLAGATCAALRSRLGTGYTTATPDTLQRRFITTGGTITTHDTHIDIHLDRRTYSPVLRAANLPTTTIPWWDNRQLRFHYT